MDFGQGAATLVPAAQRIPRVSMMNGLVSVTIAQETESISKRVFSKRLVPIEGDWRYPTALWSFVGLYAACCSPSNEANR